MFVWWKRRRVGPTTFGIMSTVLSAVTPYKLAYAYFERISCQHLEAKKPGAFGFRMKKKTSRARTNSLCAVRYDMASPRSVRRPSSTAIDAAGPYLQRASSPTTWSCKRQTCSVRTGGLNLSSVQFNFGIIYSVPSGFGGLGVACWPLVPKVAGSNPAEAVRFLGRKNPQHAFLRRGSKPVGATS